MAREVKLVDKSQAVWYTPAAFGNRASKDPFRMHLAPMSAEDFQKLSAIAVRKMSKLAEEGGDEAAIEAVGHNVTDAMLRKHVVGVSGYTGRDASRRLITPTNGDELLAVIYAADSEELELRNELARALQDSARLAEGLEKKSVTPSASSARPASQLIPGPAQSAASEPKVLTPSSTQLSS